MKMTPLKFPVFDHAAIRISAVMAEFSIDFCATGKSLSELSSNAAWAMLLLTSEKAKWRRPVTAWRRSGVFSSRLA